MIQSAGFFYARRMESHMRLVDLDDLISIENVSAMTGTSNPTVHKMVKQGQLPDRKSVV